MANVPVAIEIISINRLNNCLELKLHNVDQSSQIIFGDLNCLEQYAALVQEVRRLGFEIPDLILCKQDLVSQLNEIDEEITLKKTSLETLEKESKQATEKVKNENPIPNYDIKLSETMTTRSRTGGMIASVVTATLGIFVFFSGESNINRWLGGFLFLGGGLATAGVYSTEANDSKEANENRMLRQEAARIKELITETERDEGRKTSLVRSSLKSLQHRKKDTKQKLSEAEGKIQLAEIIKPLNEKLGNSIIFGDERSLLELQSWMTEYTASDSSNSNNLAGVALIGLMVAGAFLGFGS